jgi:hypothetical protein
MLLLQKGQAADNIQSRRSLDNNSRHNIPFQTIYECGDVVNWFNVTVIGLELIYEFIEFIYVILNRPFLFNSIQLSNQHFILSTTKSFMDPATQF